MEVPEGNLAFSLGENIILKAFPSEEEGIYQSTIIHVDRKSILSSFTPGFPEIGPAGAYSCEGQTYMRPRDMLKFGVAFLNDGMRNHQRIISKEWVEKSRTVYGNNTGINKPGDDSGRNGYSYSWWTNEVSGAGKRARLFKASGWGGQAIIVVPDLNLVIVFTGGNYVVKKHYHEILERFVLPAIQ
jgi:CubicO group peptidase (beta-lactamase class C family)